MIPKSLHTISALVNVARYIDARPQACDCLPLAIRAAQILGYPVGTPDTHGLIERAAAVILRSVK